MIKDLKELQKLLKLCRTQGVTEISLGDCHIKLGDLPYAGLSSDMGTSDSTDPYSNFPQGDLSPEQLMFYSAGGLPENDPYLKDDH